MPPQPYTPAKTGISTTSADATAGYGLAILVLSPTDPANLTSPPPPRELWHASAPAAAGIVLSAALAFRALRR